MSVLLTIRIALRALRKNKMRAGLTILGVVIGIAAVTTMVSIGQSGSQLVQGQFEMVGTNVIIVVPASRRGHGGVRQARGAMLTSKDFEAVRTQCPAVLAASPMIGTAGQVVYRNSNCSPNEISGVGVDYLTVRNWPIQHGGFFTERDVYSAAKVCVIGHSLVGKLFQTTNPIGETVRVKNVPFRVIGILESKGANMIGQDQDNIILMPYTTVRKRLHGSGFDYVGAMLVSARSLEAVKEAQSEIHYLLCERHKIAPGEPPDFEVQSMEEFAKIFAVVTGTLTMMLASIAGISLLVGGVGIMNIMLVSVTERTREIGIRMAVGARPGDILRQFLVESVLLSCIGGIIGFGLGVGASTGATMLINHFSSGTEWPIVISFPAALIAFLFASAVGVSFGFYPAWRASRLDPIDALRYE